MLLCIFNTFWVKAAEPPIQVLSPKSGEVILNGELLIVLNHTGTERITLKDIQILLDKIPVYTGIQIRDNQISILYTNFLSSGKHQLTIRLKGFTGEINHVFYVGINDDNLDKSQLKALMPKDSIRVSGFLQTDVRSTQLSGSGSAIRQEPAFTGNFNFNVNVQQKDKSVYARFFVTSDEYNFQKGVQSRNFFQVGVRNKKWNLTIGDQNPVLDRLIMSGMRVNGIQLNYEGRKFGFTALYGLLNRPLEGSLEKFTGGFAPPTLNSDGTYIRSGFYLKDVLGLQFTFGKKEYGSLLKIHGIKSRDWRSSIRYGLNPKDNAAVGISEQWISRNQKTRIEIGAAISLVTDDIGLGSMSKTDYDSVMKDNVMQFLNPETLEPLFVLNRTTVLPSQHSISYYASFSQKLHRNHVVFINYTKNAPSYFSVANPFFRNDIEQIELSERFAFWKNKIRGSVRYIMEQNNLNKAQFTTNTMNTFGANITFRPKSKWPTFFGNFTKQDRMSDKQEIILAAVNSGFLNYSGGVSYDVMTKKVKHAFNIMKSRVQRTDAVFASNNNGSSFYSVSLRQSYPFNLFTDFNFQFSDIVNAEQQKSPLSQNFGANISYKFFKNKFNMGLTYQENTVYSQFLSFSSTRPFYAFRLAFDSLKGSSFLLETGYTPNRDNMNPLNNYDEIFVFLKYVLQIQNNY